VLGWSGLYRSATTSTWRSTVIVSSWAEVINSDWGMYFLADEWQGGESADNDMGVGAAQVNGFFGMRTPWSCTALTGTRYGPVRLTVEVHDEHPAAQGIGDHWSEIVEVGFRVRSGEIKIRQWGGEPITTLELLPVGWWRLRAHARGRDEGHARSRDPSCTEEPVEEHLIQFWLGPSIGDTVILTQDRFGGYQRGDLSP